MLALRQRKDVQEKIKAHLLGPTNPFNDPIVREKSQLANKAKGYAHLCGGNGTPLPLPQQILAAALGWPTEYAVTTKRKSPYPTAYKIDIANPTLKVAIEVDGPGHLAAKIKKADAKKDALLTEMGWTVLRFKNKSVLNDLASVLKKIHAACST